MKTVRLAGRFSDSAGVPLTDSTNDIPAESARPVVCPYCDYERHMPPERLPARPVAATCPRCGSRFMYRPVPPDGAAADGSGREGKPRIRTDYDLIKEEFFSFYANLFRGNRENAKFVALLFVLYGLMYFVVTAFYYYVNGGSGISPAGLSDYMPSLCMYVMFFPVVAIHSWKYVEMNSGHLVDQLFRYSSTFAAVTVCYALFLYVTSLFFSPGEMPLALVIPVVGSSLIPSLLHALVDSL